MAAEVTPFRSSNGILIQLDKARIALAKAKDIHGVKGIRDFAKSAADLLKQQRLSQDVVFDALELKLWAERRLGIELKTHVKTGNPQLCPEGIIRKLPSGISPKQSQHWQKSAEVPEDLFCGYLQRCRQRYEEPTTKGVLRLLVDYQDKERNRKLPGYGLLVYDLEELIASGNKFGTIYADPPWQYDNQGTRARTDRHYPTLTAQEIADLPVGRIADGNAHLHLWVTNAFLFEADKVIRSWGFEYKSVFVWVKPYYGIGNY